MPRLFFALQPLPAEQAAISSALLSTVRAIGARPVPAADLHLTLAFLGEVAAEAIPELQHAAAAQASGMLHIRLSQMDCWKGSDVLCLLPDETAPAPFLRQLARSLGDAALAAGIALDYRPFRPHVTVARKVPPLALRVERWPQPLPAALPFTANGFVLMESTRQPQGPRYTVIDSWPSRDGDM